MPTFAINQGVEMFDIEKIRKNFNSVKIYTNIDFTLIIPTRSLGRQEWLDRSLNSFYGKAMYPNLVEAIVLLDSDDPETCAATQKLVLKYEEKYDANIKMVIQKRDINLFTEKYQNYGVQCSTGKFTWALNDECEMVTQDWDEIIRKALCDFYKIKRSTVAYIAIDDDTHVKTNKWRKYGCCFPILTIAATEAINGNFPAEISNWGADSAIYSIFTNSLPDHIIDLTNQVSLIHHSSHNGRREADDIGLQVSNNSTVVTLSEGEMKMYERRLKEVVRSELEPFVFWIEKNLVTEFNKIPEVRELKPSLLQRMFYHTRKRLGLNKRKPV